MLKCTHRVSFREVTTKSSNSKVLGASDISMLPKLRKDAFMKPSRATSASESPTIMSVMDIPTNWRRWRLLRGAVKQKSAFTLAEVLITLGIIGIVSALTLPVLMQNINGHKYRTQFKKSISTLAQAVRMAQEQYELTFAMLDQTCEDTGVDANPKTSSSMCAMFNGTLKGATYVGPASDIYKEKDIKIGDYPISDYLVYRLSDGSLVGFYKDLKTCAVPTGTQLTESVLTGSGALKNCLGFIDVNGDKNPNELVQGASADSISWLFGMPVAYGAGYGYNSQGQYGDGDEYIYTSAGYNAQGQFGAGDEFIYNYSDLKYNAQGQRGVGDEYVYTSNEFYSLAKYNAQGQMGIGDGYIYRSSDLKYNAQGQWGVGDGFIYNWSDLKFNAQGQGGVGDGYNYNSIYESPSFYGCGCSLNGHIITCYMGGSLDTETLAYCENKQIDGSVDGYLCTTNSGDKIGFLSFELEEKNIFDSYVVLGNAEVPNIKESCSASSFDPSATCRVENKSGQISDIFPIVFHDGVVEPASGPARAVLHQTK